MSRAGNIGGGASQAQVNTAVAAAIAPLPAVQAKTPQGGTALTAATPTILQWIVPNDGNEHLFIIAATLVVTTLLVGGQVSLTFTSGAAPQNLQVFAGSEAAGTYFLTGNGLWMVDPNTIVRINQATGLTGGAGSVLAAILGV